MQEQVAQALMYQPYGKIEEVGSPAAGLDVREKFTTKEFDEDGAPMGKLEFEMVFNLGADDAVDLDKTKWNAIGVYYTDILTPRAEAVGDIIMLEVDEATNTAVAKASITYTEEKQIKWIGIQLNGENIESQTPTFAFNCAITPINEDVGPGTKMTIHKIVENSSELETVVHKDSLTYTSTSCDLVGIGQYYFGARYYDPEICIFTSVDPQEQFFNGYNYCGNNPINIVDPNGEWGWAAGLLWGAAIGGAVGTGIGAIADKNFGDNWWKWTLGGAAAGSTIGFLGSENFINFAQGEGFLTNAQLNRSADPILFAGEGAAENVNWTPGKYNDPAKNLDYHYEKHVIKKGEFPEIKSKADYLRKAENFIKNPPSGTKIDVLAKKGVIEYYHPGSNTFVSATTKGVPKTMFRPNPTWLAGKMAAGTFRVGALAAGLLVGGFITLLTSPVEAGSGSSLDGN